MLPVHKIIIHCNRMGLQAVDPELNGKPVRKRCLPEEDGPGDQDKFYILPLGDLSGNLADAPLLICLLYQTTSRISYLVTISFSAPTVSIS